MNFLLWATVAIRSCECVSYKRYALAAGTKKVFLRNMNTAPTFSGAVNILTYERWDVYDCFN